MMGNSWPSAQWSSSDWKTEKLQRILVGERVLELADFLGI
jgi:hypothetical protein